MEEGREQGRQAAAGVGLGRGYASVSTWGWLPATSFFWSSFISMSAWWFPAATAALACGKEDRKGMSSSSHLAQSLWWERGLLLHVPTPTWLHWSGDTAIFTYHHADTVLGLYHKYSSQVEKKKKKIHASFQQNYPNTANSLFRYVLKAHTHEIVNLQNRSLWCYLELYSSNMAVTTTLATECFKYS